MTCTYGSETCGVSCVNSDAGKLWPEFYKLCDKIDCPICSEGCHKFVQAERDRIALMKGKEVHDMKNLKEHANDWKCAGERL